MDSIRVPVNNLNELAAFVHGCNRKWWEDPRNPGVKIERNKGEMIALMHSELSEMLEGVRKSIPDDKLPGYPMEQVELVDCMIRMFDYAGAYGFDLSAIFEEKMVYNAMREDHKHEARLKAGGKAF